VRLADTLARVSPDYITNTVITDIVISKVIG
jgi:hypothetical protein